MDTGFEAQARARAAGARTSKRAGNLRVGARLPSEYLQLLPNPSLKRRSPANRAAVPARRFAFRARNDFPHPLLSHCAPERFRPRIFFAKFREQLGFGISEIHGGNTAFRGGHQNFSQLCICDRESSFIPFPPF